MGCLSYAPLVDRTRLLETVIIDKVAAHGDKRTAGAVPGVSLSVKDADRVDKSIEVCRKEYEKLPDARPSLGVMAAILHETRTFAKQRRRARATAIAAEKAKARLERERVEAITGREAGKGKEGCGTDVGESSCRPQVRSR